MTITEFLREIPDEYFPRMEGPWIESDYFDPPFTMGELRKMERSGILELDEEKERFRLQMRATCIKKSKS